MKKKYFAKLIRIYEELVSILVDIAEDPAADPGSLQKLSGLTDSWIQTCVSLHPRTPSKILEEMLTRHSGNAGEDEQWRMHIVGNPSLRLKILKQETKKDPSPDVREAAITALALRMAQSSTVAPGELLKLYTAIDRSKSVSDGKRKKAAKKALFKHPKFPRDKIKRTRKG